MKTTLLLVSLFATVSAANPRLSERVGAHRGWLLAAADTREVVVTTTDGQVLAGSLLEDLPGGVMVRQSNGENVFIERARVRNIAQSLEEARPPRAPRSRDALKAELAQLLAERPGVGGGVVMIVLGGLGLVAGAGMLISGIWALAAQGSGDVSLVGLNRFGLGLLVAAIVDIVVGAVLLITGIVVTGEVGKRRRLYNERIGEIEDQLREMERIDFPRPPPSVLPTRL